MKRIPKVGFILLFVVALGMILESCASSRSNCDCNDLSRNYKAPKSYKKNVY